MAAMSQAIVTTKQRAAAPERQSGRLWPWQLGILAVLLLAWELSVWMAPERAFWVSKPSLIAERIVRDLTKGDLAWHTAVTMAETFAGLVVGVLIGVVLGLVLGVYRRLADLLEPFVMAVNSIPRIALAPFIVMYLGIGFLPKAVLAFSLVVIVVMLNTADGIRAADPTQLNVLRVMQATRWQIFTKFLLPNCVPWIVTATRISVAFAIIGVLVGEFISSQAGIGYKITHAAGAFDVTGMIVPLVVLVVISVTLDYGIRAVERRLLFWRKGPVL